MHKYPQRRDAVIAYNKKGKRKIVVDDLEYMWYVKEDDDSPVAFLTVFLGEQLFLRSHFPFQNRTQTRQPDGSVHITWRNPPPITPAIVRQEILREYQNRKYAEILRTLPDADSPEGWRHLADLTGLQPYGIGLDPDLDLLLVLCISGYSFERRLYDLQSCRLLASDTTPRQQLQLYDGLCEGIGPIAGKRIPMHSWRGGQLPRRNAAGDALYLPHFSPQDVYFQPAGQDCLNDEQNAGCVRIRRGYGADRCGFSASGRQFVVVCNTTASIWERTPHN